MTRVSGSSTNAGWTRVTSGTNPTCTPYQGAGMAQFDAFNINAGNNFSLRSPEITFAGGSYRVKFKMYRDGGYSTDADRIRVFFNTTTAPGGTLLGTVNRSIALAPVVSENGWYSYAFNLPANLSGTGYVSFLATSAYGNRIFLDDVQVMTVANDDAEMVSLNLADIFAASGNIQFAGTFKNMGANTLNSVDLKWQVGNGEIHTQTLNGLNLALGAVYEYTCAETWAALPGDNYSVRVWTENPNGITDTDLTNDDITKTFSVASNMATRLPLYEKFSSSTCGPCYTFNTNYFNNFSAANHSNFALINYQVNWPGSGDPYYTPEIGSRVGFYGINSAPTLLVDATDGTEFSNSALQSTLNAEMAKPAFFAINASKIQSGNDITVNVDVTPYLSGNYTLQVAVVEKVTTGNIASNGETEFHNVMMKMMPNPSGTAITCVRDVQQSVQLSANLSNTNIEDFADLDVVVFVQDANKRVMQAGYAQTTLANDQFSKGNTIKLFPNPTAGVLRLNSVTPVNVTITDLTGKTIFVQKAVTNENTIDLSAFQSGIYMAKLDNGTAQEVQKVILK